MKNLKWLLIPLIIIIPIFLINRYPDSVSSSMDKSHLIYSILLLVVISSAAIVRVKENVSFAIKSILTWIVIIGVLVLGYSYRYELKDIKDRVTGELAPSKAMKNEQGEIVVRRSSDDHFYIDTLVNGRPTKFMIDTGATDIALAPQAAERLGFDLETLSYNMPYSTANGIGWGAGVVLDKIEVEGMVFYNVPASVNKSGLDTSLLGMSFLNEFSSYEVTQDKLILRR